ncbi:hypothetical protein INT47_000094, partial [Mucor saturninus]
MAEYTENHLAHSLILDPSDTHYAKYDIFIPDELKEFQPHHEKGPPSMPVPLRNYINSFNKNNDKDIRQQLFTPQSFDEEYDHSMSYDYDWVQFLVYQLLREYEVGALKNHHSEEWDETVSSCSSKRKNKDRSIGVVLARYIEPLERKKVGSKCDRIFSKESRGHNKIVEYGVSESGKCYDGDAATKRFEERSINGSLRDNQGARS